MEPSVAAHLREVSAQLDQLGIPAARGRRRPSLGAGVAGPADLAPRIEHTLLRADATPRAIAALCDEARRHRFRGVCVNPIFVEQARRALAGWNGLVVTVVGFPLGATLTKTKAEEAKALVARGADEVDMVIAVGLLKEKQYREVFEDIGAVVSAAGGAPVKVILETALLADDEKVVACLLAERAGAAYVKTSTGFAGAGAGATTADVALLRAAVGERLGVKASGGIRDLGTAIAMIDAGADVLGASASVDIMASPSWPAAG